jgi:hypothetical protein
MGGAAEGGGEGEAGAGGADAQGEELVGAQADEEALGAQEMRRERRAAGGMKGSRMSHADRAVTTGRRPNGGRGDRSKRARLSVGRGLEGANSSKKLGRGAEAFNRYTSSIFSRTKARTSGVWPTLLQRLSSRG